MRVYCCLKLLLTAYWIHSTGAAKNMWNSTYVDQLKHDLLYKYDKFARPSQHFNTTTVFMALEIKHVEIDELKSMMIINGWNKLEWIDEKLKWDANEYGGMKNLHIADHEIWQPDIVLYNSAQANNIDHYGNTHCIVASDGTVLWVPPAQFPIYCDLDLTWWPYDLQSCGFYFGSWTYSGQQINLTVREGEMISSADGQESGDWELVSVKSVRHEITYSCCPEPYHRVDYIVTVKRRSPAYHAILFTPAAMSIVLTLAVFWLTPTANEKFLLSGVTSIIISMYLIYFTQRLPAVSTRTPVVVQFYSANLCLVCLSMVISVVTHNLSRKTQGRPVPWIIIKLLTGKLGRFLSLPTTKNSIFVQSFTDKGEEMQECNLVKEDCSNRLSNRNDSDWQLVAVALDRIMFITYIVLFALIIFFCLV